MTSGEATKLEHLHSARSACVAANDEAESSTMSQLLGVSRR
jgi:hypothetical protein